MSIGWVIALSSMGTLLIAAGLVVAWCGFDATCDAYPDPDPKPVKRRAF